MTLGGEVHHRIWSIFLKKMAQAEAVADAVLLEGIVQVLVRTRQ